MKSLTFCPECGTDSLQWDGEKHWTCPRCSFSLYHNVAGAVAVLIKFREKILLTRRAQDPQKGKLDMAGGFVDPKESAEETCRRELQEELAINIRAENLKYLGSLPNIYHYKGIDYHTLDLFFQYELENESEFNLDVAEISEAVWMNIKDLDVEDIAFESQKKFLRQYQKEN